VYVKKNLRMPRMCSEHVVPSVKFERLRAVGGKDAIDRLAVELRSLAGLDWDQPAQFGDFEEQRELANLFGLSGGQRDVEKLRRELVQIVEKTREEEADDPPKYSQSLAVAWTSLLQLDEESNGALLKKRRETIRKEWKTAHGKQIKSVASVKENFEPRIYKELARRVLTDRAGTRSRTSTKRRGRGSSQLPPASRPGGGRDPKQAQDVIILIAAMAKRRGPTSGLIKLVREFEPYWRATGSIVYSLEGSYREIWRAGLLHNYENFKALPAGFYGGLVYATEEVIAAAEASPPLSCHVVYLVDPHDNSSLYPATASIKRECILTQTPFLTTYQGAARWFRLDWARRAAEGEGAEAHKLLLARPKGGFPEECELGEQFGPVALAAHDRHKVTMMDFVEAHADLLTNRFPERWSTRVTGHLLNGGSILDQEYENDILYDVKEEGRDEVKARIASKTEEWGEQKREGGPGNRGWVTQMTRGREGGVIQLARKVLDDECDTILFFEDAETPDDQDMEIQVLDRAAQLTDGNCLLLYDERSADQWAENVALCAAEDGKVSATTLVEAFRRVFDVELVIARPDPQQAQKRGTRRRGKETGSNPAWEQIAKTAAIHIFGVLSTIARDRDEGEGPVRFGLPWGGAIRDVIGELPGNGDKHSLVEAIGLHRFVEKTEEAGSLSDSRNFAMSTGQWPPLVQEHSPPFNSEQLSVVPAVGVMGALDRSLESHSLVARAVKILGGTPVPYPESAFALKGGTEIPLDTTPKEEWERLDVLLITANPLEKRLKHALATGLPADLADHYKGCACAVGTFYLEESDDGVAERSHPAYTQVGIAMGQIQGLKEGGAEVVLVNGADKSKERRRAAWAALKAGLASTFVTDEDFAWAVLEEEVPGLKPSNRGR
jgi:methylglyoxal synthase